MHDPIAYTYEADHHCPDCTERRFGRAADGYIAGQDEQGDYPRDNEGNEVHALFSWDEWHEPSEPLPQVLACGSCGAEIARVED